MSELIYADNVSLIRGRRLLFKQLSFTLHAGEAIHLQGHNGSGKTSLFKLLTGVLNPDRGQLSVLGYSPQTFESEIYHQLLYLGHQTAIKHELTVMENLRLNSALFDGIKANQAQLNHALVAVGLLRFSEQLAGKLSAGQKRRVMLARLWLAIDDGVLHQQLWLLDEPLAALDIESVGRLQTHIDDYLSLGGGVIFTSHQAFDLSHSVQTVMLGGDS
ncbi:MAG: cytochrome c biogenesis heme-transporting ATPase CcmA [Ostreibacterium sp.]